MDHHQNYGSIQSRRELADLMAANVFDKGPVNPHCRLLIERTLAIIKPDGMIFRNEILKRIRNANFEILQSANVNLTIEQASQFYELHIGTTNPSILMMTLTEGPIEVLCLSKTNAIEDWKALMGPENIAEAKSIEPQCIRAKYGNPKDSFRNLVHGSENKFAAQYEIRLFFPEMIIEPIVDGKKIEEYLQASVYKILWKGLSFLARERPNEPICWLAQWLLENNFKKPKILAATSGKSVKLVRDLHEDCSYKTMSSMVDSSTTSVCIPSSKTSSTILSTVHSLPSSNSYIESNSDIVGKCLMCPKCQKLTRLLFFNGDVEDSTVSILDPSKVIALKACPNHLSIVETVQCENCQGIIYITTKKCSDPKTNLNLDFILDCEKKREALATVVASECE